MNELTKTGNNLPATIGELSKFVLVGREKLTSVRAEIRAIEKLELAQEVRNQKRDEAKMLSEALLDAEVKLGDLMKQIPKATHDRGNQYTGGKSTAVSVSQKTKAEVIENLGFTQKQAERFEILADNKDVVEQVKAEARENDDIPTRTRVLDLVAHQKQKDEEEYDKYMDGGDKRKTLNKIVAQVKKLRFTDEDIDDIAYWHSDAIIKSIQPIDETLKDIIEAVKILNNIYIKLSNRKGNYNAEKRN